MCSCNRGRIVLPWARPDGSTTGNAQRFRLTARGAHAMPTACLRYRSAHESSRSSSPRVRVVYSNLDILSADCTTSTAASRVAINRATSDDEAARVDRCFGSPCAWAKNSLLAQLLKLSTPPRLRRAERLASAPRSCSRRIRRLGAVPDARAARARHHPQRARATRGSKPRREAARRPTRRPPRRFPRALRRGPQEPALRRRAPRDSVSRSLHTVRVRRPASRRGTGKQGLCRSPTR